MPFMPQNPDSGHYRLPLTPRAVRDLTLLVPKTTECESLSEVIWGGGGQAEVH